MNQQVSELKISQAKSNEEKQRLEQIEWLLKKGNIARSGKKKTYRQAYGNLSDLNTCRVLLNAVGKDALTDIVNNSLELLDTSAAIYEKDGSYALGIYSSKWCRLLNGASRYLCGTDDNKEALESGKWHCHESCWKVSKLAIETGQAVTKECYGGIYLYAVPIWANGEVVGSMNFGYGSPPKELQKLKQIAVRYNLSVEELRDQANAYEFRPPFLIEIAKKRLVTSARLIGAIIERNHAEQELQKAHDKLETLVKERTKKLADSENSYRTLAQNLPGIVYRIFLREGNRMQFFNNMLQAMTGFEAEELIKDDVCQIAPLILPEDRENVIRIVMYAIKHNRAFTVDYRIKHKEGDIRYFHEQGRPVCGEDAKPLYIEGVIIDITELEDTKQQLSNSKEILALTIENIGDAVISTDKEGRIVLMNHVAQKLTGYSESEAKGQSIQKVFRIINKKTRKAIENPVKKVLQSKKIVELADDTLLIARDGVEYLITDSAAPMKKVPNGAVIGAVWVFQDITEKHKMAEKLIQEDRMASLGTLLFGVAHEINNPNNLILPNIEIVKQAWKDILPILREEYRKNKDFMVADLPFSEAGEEISALIDGIYEGSVRIKKIIENLKDFICEDTGDKEEAIDMKFVVQAAKYICANQIKNSTNHFKIKSKKDMPKVRGNFQQLEQVVINLINNSCQALPNPDRSLVITIDYNKEINSILLKVKDEGIGIPKENLPHIFDPFFTTKPNGTGLGLGIVKKIVDAHGGEIRIQPIADVGTEVLLQIPLA
ncbi:MAG: PAS domain S-box protein [bacterium]